MKTSKGSVVKKLINREVSLFKRSLGVTKSMLKDVNVSSTFIIGHQVLTWRRISTRFSAEFQGLKVQFTRSKVVQV